MSDERESSAGVGALIVILLAGVLGVGLLGVLAVAGLFLFSVRSARMESSHVMEARAEAEMAHAVAQQARLQMEEAAAHRSSADVTGISVTVNAAGQYALAGEAKTADELEALLVPFARDNPGSPFIIRADQDAPLDPVFKLLEIGKRVGITNYQVSTGGTP